MSDGRLLMMLVVQALFEGSLLVWILIWVPAVTEASEVGCRDLSLVAGVVTRA